VCCPLHDIAITNIGCCMAYKRVNPYPEIAEEERRREAEAAEMFPEGGEPDGKLV